VQIRILPEKLTLLWNGNNTQKTMPNNQTKRGSKPAGRASLDDDPFPEKTCLGRRPSETKPAALSLIRTSFKVDLKWPRPGSGSWP
jgi:hypothetical protein